MFGSTMSHWMDHWSRVMLLLSSSASYMVRSFRTYWLDGVDDVNEGDWRWASNFDERITQTFWYPGEPNQFHGNEDCMDIKAGEHGLWNDEDCSSRLYCICEIDT